MGAPERAAPPRFPLWQPERDAVLVPMVEGISSRPGTRPTKWPPAWAWFCGGLAVWWAFLVVLLGRLPTHDDYFRIHLARFAFQDESLLPWLAHWLPLPTAAQWLVLGGGSAAPWPWLSGLPALGAIVLGIGLWVRESSRRPCAADGGAWSALLLLGWPLLLLVVLSALSEPFVLLGLCLAWIGLRLDPGDGTPWRRAAWITAGGVVLALSRYEWWLFVAAAGIAGAWRSRAESTGSREWLRVWLASAVVLAVVPLAWLAANQILSGRWNAPFLLDQHQAVYEPSLGERLGLIAYAGPLWAPVAFVAALGGAALLAMRRQFAAIGLALLPAIPFIAVIVRSGLHPMWPERFLLGAVASAALLGGVLLRALAARGPRWTAVCFVVAMLGIVHGAARAPGLTGPQYIHELIRAAGESIPRDGVVLFAAAPWAMDPIYLSLPLARSQVRFATQWSGEPTGDPLDALAIRHVVFDDEQRLAPLGLPLGDSRPVVGTWRVAPVEPAGDSR